MWVSMENLFQICSECASRFAHVVGAEHVLGGLVAP
jgi:hypothetical protein